MLTLNLVNSEEGDIKFIVSEYPDNQRDIRITKIGAALIADYQKQPISVMIKARFVKFGDLELITCAVKALRNLDVDIISLYVPWIPGLRSDRQERLGGTSYVRDVIAPALNALNLDSIVCIDPHSDVAAACIPKLRPITNAFIVQQGLASIYQGPSDNFIFVAPDAGSVKKIYKTAKEIFYQREIIVCSKFRNWDGEITRMEVPIPEELLSKDFIIVDDICDGGATFISLAKKIKEKKAQHGVTEGKICLIVTHGIFSKGFEPLFEHIDYIVSSNSYATLPDLPNLKQINVY